VATHIVRPITVPPHAGKGVEVAGAIPPSVQIRQEPQGHRRHTLGDDQFALLPAERMVAHCRVPRAAAMMMMMMIFDTRRVAIVPLDLRQHAQEFFAARTPTAVQISAPRRTLWLELWSPHLPGADTLEQRGS
jgi:hypothetical protein